ncbi:MAG: hypothetical protein E7246_01535 [Lachnoclostridium sp.]|nr:hypothetical protein [Lachnoclostridium sp.]
MGVPNLAVNRVMKRKDIFADYINGTIYGGRRVLEPEELTEISPYVGTMVEDSNGKKKEKERTGDVWMRAEHGTYSVIFVNEAQNKVDYAMPVRNMLYEALGYMSQVEEYEKAHREKKDLKDSVSFLSGITKEDLLMPIVTTVLYWGDYWDGPTRLIDMMDLGDDEESPILKKYLPDYRIHVVKMKEFENPDRFGSCLQHMFNLVKYKNDRIKFASYLNQNQEDMNRMDKYEVAALGTMIGMEKELIKLLENNQVEEETNVCKAILDWMEENRTEGRLEGRIEGRMQLLIGQICKKLQKGKDVAKIAEELEEESSIIQEICNLAMEFAPEYDVETIAEAWFDKNH